MSETCAKFINYCLFAWCLAYSPLTLNNSELDSTHYLIGKQLYTQGLLPGGERVKAVVQGDIQIEGDQLICETCHRKSGMGSNEGQQVVPAVAGQILFKPLKLPTSRPPEPPIFREGYTKQTLMAAVRDGIDANGEPLDPFMPRYDIDEAALNGLAAYLDTLSQTPSPGVSGSTIHFATIVLSSNRTADNKALLDVMHQYVAQKNVETRHESKRALNAPWHKAWLFKPYRKWQLHTWVLTGPEESWTSQLDEFYTRQPVFAVINGLVPVGWEGIHRFCESQGLPCLFPTTQTPVLSEQDFYTLYMDKGVVQEGEALASHVVDSREVVSGIVQFIDNKNPLSGIAAESFRSALQASEIPVANIVMNDLSAAYSHLERLRSDQAVVFWLDPDQTNDLLGRMDAKTQQVYLSTRFYGTSTAVISPRLHDRISFVHSSEMPGRLDRLLARSTGWFKAKRIYNDQAKEIQANAYFALKVAGDAVKHIRGYFYRDYFIEKIEHMIDDVPYTSIYPRISLAPDQRFVSRGFYIAKIDKPGGGLVSLTDWKAP
ncbi:MAG: cytochrome c [Candidatus Thiodiazotropha sp. (ex Dulcina madagascariensis)]|nr:cytochrome c [Candidatus Thiodiazotropha sp. (ex Dulcina madagascariensis)]